MTRGNMTRRDDRHWLVRPGTIRGLWVVFILVLAASVAVNAVIPVPGHFGIDGTFGFFAWYGLATCIAMIVGAKILGVFLKREDTYYDD